MSFFKDFLKSKKNTKDPYENAPVFKQMMMDLKREENEFIERFEKIVPVIRFSQPDPEIISGGEAGHEPESSLPVSYPLDFDSDLSIFLGIDTGEEYEWLLNRQIVIVKDKISPDKMVSKAFGNLFREIEKKISVSMITDDMGMLENCNSLESGLVLINEVWCLARRFVRGDDLLFAIPARDVFIFTPAGDDEALKHFRKKVKEFIEDPAHPDKLSSKLYIKRKNGKTEVWEG
jgi:hypothetical protein